MTLLLFHQAADKLLVVNQLVIRAGDIGLVIGTNCNKSKLLTLLQDAKKLVPDLSNNWKQAVHAKAYRGLDDIELISA